MNIQSYFCTYENICLLINICKLIYVRFLRNIIDVYKRQIIHFSELNNIILQLNINVQEEDNKITEQDSVLNLKKCVYKV